jgi:hypothetical protein
VWDVRAVLPWTAVVVLLCGGLTTFANTSFAQQGRFVLIAALNTARNQHAGTVHTRLFS